MTVLREGVVGGALNVFFIYKFLRILTQPFNETDAFKLGIIDENGKILKKHKKLKTTEEKDSYTLMHRLVWKLKRLMEKIPFGKSRLASYAAALWLIKESHKFNGTEEELQETFLSFLETDWKGEAQIIKEVYEADLDKKTFSNLREDHMKPDKKGHNLPPHLAKFFDKKGNLKKDAADRIRKGRKERGVKITDRTPDWMFKEVAPPGWEGTIKAMKKKKGIDNPWALAWHMHNKGMKPHIPEELGGIMEEILDEKRKSLKNTKDVGMECQECGKKFRAKLSTLEYGKTKCPKCKSTDLDFQFGEDVEVDEKLVYKFKVKPKKVKKLKDLRFYANPAGKSKPSKNSTGFSKYSDTSRKMTFVGKSKKPRDFGYVHFGTELDGEEINEKDVAVPATVDNLKQIVKDKQNAVFMFKDGKVRVDLFSASALMGVYNALKPATRKKFETMIKTKGGFMKSVDFAFKMAKEEVAPHAKVMAKRGDSPEKIKDMHPEITDDELEKLFKEEFNISTVTTFKSFLSEGRPSLDPDYVPATTQTDKMRAKLLSTQKKLYSSQDIESMARKYKQKLVGDPVGGKSWGGDWEIVLRNGVSLSYEYGPNSTYIKGWKFDRKAIQNYIGKYANEHETPRDYAPMGGKVLVGGLEAAFEVISEAAGFHNYPKRNKVGDEIEKLASKGGAEADKLFVIATALQKGRIPNKFIRELSPKRKKEVHAIMKDFKWKILPEEDELDENKNMNNAADEIENWAKLGSKRGLDRDDYFKIVADLRKGKLPTGPRDKRTDTKMISSVLAKYGIKEEDELDEWKYNWAVIDTADKNRVQALTSDEKGARSSMKSATISKHDYHYGKDPKTLKVVKLKKAHKDNDIGDPLKEEAPANSVAGGNVNLDPFKKKRKNAKVETETFAGSMVFIVPPNVYYDSRLGKSRYLRYEKFVGNDKLGEAIRQYGKENPNSAIILKNSVNGAMLYLKYGKK